MNQLAATENIEQRLTPANVRSHVNLIQEVMRGIMKKDTHYGIIPGCKQPTLYKAGSEVLLTTFRISVEPEVEDLSRGDDIRYRVRAVGRHQVSGIVVGIGIGECSSSEDKYKWRSAVCDEEFDTTAEDRRRIKYGRKQNGFYTAKQVRTEPADIANTVLKMAKKRAQIDLTLTATSASDIFSQDLEDLSPEIRESIEVSAPPPIQQPQSRSGQPATTQGRTQQADHSPITDKQVKLIFARLKTANITVPEFCTEFEIDSLEALPFAKVNNALSWIAEHGGQ